MSEYSSAIALAARLIAKKGRTVKLIPETTTTADPTKPWRVSVADEAGIEVKAVQVALEDKYVDGTTVLQTDSEFLVAAQNLPDLTAANYKFEDRGYDNRIVKTDVIEPGDDKVMYVLIVRA